MAGTARLASDLSQIPDYKHSKECFNRFNKG